MAHVHDPSGVCCLIDHHFDKTYVKQLPLRRDTKMVALEAAQEVDFEYEELCAAVDKILEERELRKQSA